MRVQACWLTEKTLTKRKGWRNPAASMGDITDVGLEQARVFLEQNTVPNGFIYLVMADAGMGHAFFHCLQTSETFGSPER
ncbi:hypothetical protein GHT06_007849 [Daphnia sinensis]|uniref:Uncharacterized protein n=1 Tax=Daphnia sinensis TaxID=1820382 RepID=A0AAD5L0E5_9CRUS|nr:hypothetical protein GHT06_007849 [Daphnia sinensis]